MSPAIPKTNVKRQVGRPPGTPETGSRLSQMRLLQVGESLSISSRLEVRKHTEDDVKAAREALRQSLKGAVVRCQAENKSMVFEMNTGSFLTSDRKHEIVSAVATRVK